MDERELNEFWVEVTATAGGPCFRGVQVDVLATYAWNQGPLIQSESSISARIPGFRHGA